VWGGGTDTLLVGSDGARLVAACQLHPLRQWIAGEAVGVTGIGTVAISPAHRKRGIARDLVAFALRAGRERGDTGSALFPFRVSFYRRLGYGLAGEAHQYRIPPRSLPDDEGRQHIEMMDDDDARTDALTLYGEWIRQQTGQLARSMRLWLHILADDGRALFGWRAPDGSLEGYALVIYRTDLPPAERFLEVDELIWTTERARRGLYGWLASLDDQWQQIVLRALPAQRMGDWLSEPLLPHGAAPAWRLWAPAATLMTGPMFRLLDVRGAFEGRRVEDGPPMACTFDVADDVLPENAGSWRIALDAGRAAVERAGASDLTLRLDVSTLSRIFIGALAPSAALAAGLLECDRPEMLRLLDAALTLPEPWTFDRF
jgi:predicted acetyltransferase